MMIQQPPELFAQRPVRSDYGRRSGGGSSLITPRRVLFFIALLILCGIGGFGYNALQGDEASEGAEAIPTIEAEMPIKQRPENPGGIDIPHQDVSVFQQLDEKNGAAPAQGNVEQLLPAPETPQAPAATASNSAAVASPNAAIGEAPKEDLPPAVTEVPSAPLDTPVKVNAKKQATEVPVTSPATPKAVLPEKTPVKPVKVEKVVDKKEPVKKETAEQAKGEAAMAKLPKALFTTGEAPAATAPVSTAVEKPAPASPPQVSNVVKEQPVASGKMAKVQLASYPNEVQAQSEMKKFAVKYAGSLGGVSLTIVRADLAKGTYYRIMSAPIDESKAKSICASILQQKGACLLAR